MSSQEASREEIDLYIEAHTSPEPAPLRKLARDVNVRLLYPRMCSGHVQGRLLAMLSHMISPRAILELGTYAGYSALCLAEGLQPGGTLDTVEIDDEMEDFIRGRFDASPIGASISLHIGDAVNVMKMMIADGRIFDLIFIDANKRHYCEYYELALSLLAPGGFILADNTLWSGKVVEASRASHVDAQTRGILDFNDLVASDPRVEVVILPLRDGLTLIRKIPS
ncbi:MAG: O-methyltransferase [Muribaculaceae bacterium]|nr:O-methyltransferase [Muribaculaceae bacterium]